VENLTRSRAGVELDVELHRDAARCLHRVRPAAHASDPLLASFPVKANLRERSGRPASIWMTVGSNLPVLRLREKAGIDASRPLRPAIVSFLNPEPALSLVGENRSSCPVADVRLRRRARLFMPMAAHCHLKPNGPSYGKTGSASSLRAFIERM
jgi:hypothetical protein